MRSAPRQIPSSTVTVASAGVARTFANWSLTAWLGAALNAPSLPHIVKLRRTQARLEQQIALLRHIEALRLYAAEHDGKLPAKLSDISVPLPIDPVTGKLFVYSVERATAHVRGSWFGGEQKAAGHSVHYEVTLQK